MTGTEKIMADTAFEVVARSLMSSSETDRNSFRIKNLKKEEALKFLETWEQEATVRGLENVQVLVANDSHSDFPHQYRADPQRSITYYRNNNKTGLVYIETKVESDEQGLKNLFTLRDVNFLDGTFDEGDDFSVAHEMVSQALKAADSTPDSNDLLKDRLASVSRELAASGSVLPVRKYAAFIQAAAVAVASSSDLYTSDEVDDLVGRCLVHLDMFPDVHWRREPARAQRRLSLNLLRSELAASPSADLDRDKLALDCASTKFVDEEGERYSPEVEGSWRTKCSEYCRDPSRERREDIPYRIFEQVFNKDVKGLPLGQRVSEEILDVAPARHPEFTELDVETGLDKRSVEDARRFLEADADDPDVVPLKELLTKPTRRMVDKLASPSVERVNNPLVKLSQIASAFRERNDLSDGSFRIEVRIGSVDNDHYPTSGLFAFLYGASFGEISDELIDGISSVTLQVDDRLCTQVGVPALKKDDASDPETTSEEEEGVEWVPVPLEFVLLDESDGDEIDSESAIEWLPDDLEYLVLFWVSVCGEDRAQLGQQVIAPSTSGPSWISAVSSRLLPFQNTLVANNLSDATQHPILQRQEEIRAEFRTQMERGGLSSGVLNDVFDRWLELLADARVVFTPDGDPPKGMIEFLSADCVQNFGGDSVLMLQSHPLKLRWIAAYLEKSRKLATDAIEGGINLNPQNEDFYLDWIQDLSPHQQPAVHVAEEGHLLFADGERGWTERFQPDVSAGGSSSGDRIHPALVSEIVAQITRYLHAHPYKSDGLRLLVVTPGASALPADIAQNVRKGDFKNLSITVDFVSPKSCWSEAAREFERVDAENRLSGDGALFPPVQLNLHDIEEMRANAEEALGNLVCDISIVPQFLDDTIVPDIKTEDETGNLGKFDPLLDDPTYIASGSGSSALWVSLRPRTTDPALSDWSTLAVRYEKGNPVAVGNPQWTDFVDVRINFQHTARFFNALHKRSHWVITVERHITREQIEKLETRPEVLSLRGGVGPGGLFTLIVSSNAGKAFVIDRLARKLKRIANASGRSGFVGSLAEQLAQKIYEESRQIAPRLTLDALGISRVTEEILGLSVARRIADQHMPVAVTEGLVAWISLDEHQEWFGSSNSIRADMIRLSVDQSDDGLVVDLLVVESKLRRLGFEAHGAEQVRNTLELLGSIFVVGNESDTEDGPLWRDSLLAAVDTLSDEAVLLQSGSGDEAQSLRSRVPDGVRTSFREGDFASVKMAGLYSICEYGSERSVSLQKYERDSRVQIAQSGGAALLERSVAGGKPTLEEHSGSEDHSTHVEESYSASAQGEDSSAAPTSSLQPQMEASDADISERESGLGRAELDRRYQTILDTYGQYGVSVAKTEPGVEHAIEGPASILFRIRPGQGVDPKKLSEKRDALKLALELEASQDMRFDIDKGYVTIDVPKIDDDRYFVDSHDLWAKWQRSEKGLIVPLGEDRFGDVVEIDFTSSNSPHLLIGGTTGSGKSEALNTILAGITEHYLPSEVRLHLIDPKGTELEHLSGDDHVDGDIGWDEEDAIGILAEAVDEMQRRYSIFKEAKVRSLGGYNEAKSNDEQIPRWVIVLDEYADLTSEPDAKKSIEGHLKRLAQKARAAGIHVIIATQKPDASVISTNLRSNLPAQLALRVKSSTESRVVMDDSGAETLTGKGDAFFKESGRLVRVQCAKTNAI